MDERLRRGRGAPPLYAQIADLLRSAIIEGGMGPGDRLDSEPVLSRTLGVSRVTVSKALELLSLDGLVDRRQGLGTFITRRPLDRRLPELTSFSEHIAGLGLRAGQRFVDFRKTTVGPGTSDELLAAFPLATPVVVTRRIRLVSGLPAGLHRTVVPAGVAEAIGFTEEALRSENVSLYALFNDHGVELAHADEHLRACNADDEEARLLGISPGEALMHVRRFTRDDDGNLVEAVDAHYVGALYDYRVELVRTARTRPGPEGRQDEGNGTATHRDGGGGSYVDRSRLRDRHRRHRPGL